MLVTVNGKELDLPRDTSVLQLIELQGQRAEIVAVELNMRILQREEFASTALAQGDEVEIVCFMGGGC